MTGVEVVLSIVVVAIIFVLLIGYDGYKNTGKWFG